MYQQNHQLKQMNLIGTNKPTVNSKIVPYKVYMRDVSTDINGLYWYIIIPLASIIYCLQYKGIKSFRSKYPEEFI